MGVDVTYEPWDYYLYHSNGEEVDDDLVKELYGRLYGAMDCVVDNAEEQSIVTATLREALAECGWLPQSDLEYAIERSNDECDGNVREYEAALYSRAVDPTTFLWGREYFWRDQRPRGYAGLLDEMVKDTLPAGDDRIVFDAHVDKIVRDENDSVFHVRVRDGRTFRAKDIINTMPVGVLKRAHRNMFRPMLPDIYRNLLDLEDGVQMRNVTKIFLQFPFAWWDKHDQSWVRVLETAEFTTWRNAFPGSDTKFVLVGIFGDPVSKKYESLPDQQVQDAVMATLRQIYNTISIPDPIHFLMSRHGMDETRYGAFSVFGRRWKDEYNYVFRQPVVHVQDQGQPQASANRMFFAGEAWCPAFAGFVHGALQSGLEIAARYLYHNGLLDNDPDENEALDLCMADSDEAPATEA